VNEYAASSIEHREAATRPLKWIMGLGSARVHCSIIAWLFSVGALFAQVISPGQPVPHTSSPPVVFVSGYHNDCSASTFANTFGIADQVLQANGKVSLYFDNCTVAGKPSIEKLGDAFGAFLAALKYDDGSAVNLVDVVAHSMGGLIVRSYLSGKQEQDGVFSPPAATHIRKIVLLQRRTLAVAWLRSGWELARNWMS